MLFVFGMIYRVMPRISFERLFVSDMLIRVHRGGFVHAFGETLSKIML